MAPLALSTAALVLANLVPLAGALLGIWSTYELILLFWAENVVIGLFNLGRMATVGVLHQEYAIVVLMAFFCVHYGMFTYVHGIFVVAMLGPGGMELEQAALELLEPDGLLLPLLALVASHGVSFVVNFLRGGEWRKIDMGRLMMGPYARVVILHLVIIFGGMLALSLGAPIAALAFLVVLKIGVDVVAHRREHRPRPA